SFLDICESEALSISVDVLHYFAHWITPEGSHRRYDTRFFVAPAPFGQTPAHDAGETISDMWVRPADALERHRRGELEIILPTIRNLQAIGRFHTASDLLDAASTIPEVPTVLPLLVADGGGIRVLLPGDPGYDAIDADGRTRLPREGIEVDVHAAVRLASRAANTPGAPTKHRRG
ncbi:MAG TPA: hypothetical protein VMD28_07930, partial [Acidimicrobiales bacterium]|nr:hypothetical protein [Acidimicrobiales bacterium]